MLEDKLAETAVGLTSILPENSSDFSPFFQAQKISQNRLIMVLFT